MLVKYFIDRFFQWLCYVLVLRILVNWQGSWDHWSLFWCFHLGPACCWFGFVCPSFALTRICATLLELILLFQSKENICPVNISKSRSVIWPFKKQLFDFIMRKISEEISSRNKKKKPVENKLIIQKIPVLKWLSNVCGARGGWWHASLHRNK